MISQLAAMLNVAGHSLRYRVGGVVLTMVSVALSVFVLLAVEHVRQEARTGFASTVSGVDLIVGARTGEVNLLLLSVFRIGNATTNVSGETVAAIAEQDNVEWTVPVSLGDSHRGYRVVGTTAEFFERYKYGRSIDLAFAAGETLDETEDAVLGATVAAELNYRIGDPIVVSHGVADTSFQHHDDAPFTVTGILEPTGTPVDNALFVSLEGIDAIHDDGEDHLGHHDEDDHGHDEHDAENGHDHDEHHEQDSHDHDAHHEEDGHAHDEHHNEDGHDHDAHHDEDGHAHHEHHEEDGHDHDAHHDEDGHAHDGHHEEDGHDHDAHHEEDGHDHDVHHEDDSHAHDDHHEGDHGEHGEDEHHDHDHGAPGDVTALLVGVDVPFATLSVQRWVNEYEDEALLAILPGVALAQLWEMLGTMEDTLRGVSVLVFISALFGMIAMLLASMRERRHEIEILRSIGAPSLFILGLLVVEALLIVTVGIVAAIAGLLLTIAVVNSSLATELGMSLSLQVFHESSLTALGLIYVTTVVLSLVPAWQAYRISRSVGGED